MSRGEHFGAEERLSEELKKRDRERCDEMRRDEDLRHEQAYRKGVLTPRGRKLFVFNGSSKAGFDPEHYPLALDKDIRRDPLVRRLIEEIEELKKQLPVRRQCACCGALRNIGCFSQNEDVCDKCNLASAMDELNEEHLARTHWQGEATRLGQELNAAREAGRASKELATQRQYACDHLENELLNKKLAKELTEGALLTEQQNHKKTERLLVDATKMYVNIRSALKKFACHDHSCDQCEDSSDGREQCPIFKAMKMKGMTE